MKNSVGLSEPSSPKNLKKLIKKSLESSKSKKYNLKNIFVLTVVLIVVFLTLGLFVAILIKLRRDLTRKNHLNHESKCKLNDTIESRSLQHIESAPANLNSSLKMSEKRVGTSSPHTTRSHSGPNFGIFSRITSLKRKNTNQAKKQNFLDSSINDINLIDKHINLPIALENLTSQLDMLDDKFAKIYSKESLLKRFTQDFESLDKDMHFEFCVILFLNILAS